jgi:hypothetical protein
VFAFNSGLVIAKGFTTELEVFVCVCVCTTELEARRSHAVLVSEDEMVKNIHF